MVYDFPKFQDPDIVTPQISLLIKLADPPSEIFSIVFFIYIYKKWDINSDIKIRLPITTRIQYVLKKISEKHQCAIGNILLSKGFNTKSLFFKYNKETYI